MDSGTPNQKVPPIIGAKVPPIIHRKGWSKAIAISSVAIAGVFMLVLTISFAKKHQRKALLAPVEKLFALKYPGQLPQAKPLCTEQGFKLLPQFVDESGKLSLVAFHVGDIKQNPGLCDVELRLDAAEGESRIYLRLMNENGWKFHDVYIAKMKGKEVNLLASYVVEHPFLSYAEVNSDKILEGVKETADFLNNVQQIGSSLDKIFDSGHRRSEDE